PAVLALRDRPLEAVVLDWMIFHLHRETLDRGIGARSFRHRPTLHHAVELETQIVMQSGRRVLLNHELKLLVLGRTLAATRRLSRLLEIAFFPLFAELLSRTRFFLRHTLVAPPSGPPL